MTTTATRSVLLSVPCPWCRAPVGEECTVTIGADSSKRPMRRRITTLGNGCHDARWRAAVQEAAPVLAEAIAAVTGRELTEEGELRRASDLPLPEAPSVPAMTPDPERPW